MCTTWGAIGEGMTDERRDATEGTILFDRMNSSRVITGLIGEVDEFLFLLRRIRLSYKLDFPSTSDEWI